MRYALVVLMVSASAWAGAAQPARAEADHEFQSWSAAFLSARADPVAPGLTSWLDLHVRRGEGSTLTIIRPGIGYHILDELTVWAGYAWIPLFRGGEPRNEHRAWQQLQLAGPLGQGFGGILRTRLEQRFMEGGDDVGWRIRQLARLQYSVVPQMLLVVWNELFVGLSDPDWDMPRGVDANRYFGGVGYVARPGLRFEVGYLGQWVDRNPEGIIHALSINIFSGW